MAGARLEADEHGDLLDGFTFPLGGDSAEFLDELPGKVVNVAPGGFGARLLIGTLDVAGDVQHLDAVDVEAVGEAEDMSMAPWSVCSRIQHSLNIRVSANRHSGHAGFSRAYS